MTILIGIKLPTLWNAQTIKSITGSLLTTPFMYSLIMALIPTALVGYLSFEAARAAINEMTLATTEAGKR